MDQIIPTIGHIAYQWFESYSQANVQGITSNGIFLNIKDYRIVFITENPDFGPVNIITNQKLPFHWKLRDTIHIQQTTESIRFTHPTGEYVLLNYYIWDIAQEPAVNFSTSEQGRRLKVSVSQFNTIKGQNGFTPYLQEIIKPNQNLATNDPLFKHIIEIRNSLINLDSSSFLDHAKDFIGHGGELTSSGDDFLCGILFLLNRWKFDRFSNKWIETINHELLKQAQLKTTSASCTLLDCAIKGSADYRIQELSDALLND